MGEVYLGHDTRLERRVALKCLMASGATRDEDQSRLLREARAAARLNHPNIAAVYDVLQQDERTFIVMEYVEGESLATCMARERLPLDQVRSIARQLLSALAAAHAHGVIHRDLKPANIHVAADGTVKVLDFGVAKIDRPGAAEHTVAASNPGTPLYMSPEQLFGQPLDPRSDIYSAGVILYQLATGQRPFDETNPVALALAMQSRDPAPPHAIAPDVPREFSQIVSKMLARDPADRFQSAREIEALLTTTTDAAPGVSRLPARRRVTHWNRVWIGVTAAAVLVALALVGRPLLHRAAPSSVAAAPAVLDSIAVVPLENLSADANQEYLADGMTESIITELGRVRSLRVISRQSMMQFKHARTTVPQIAAQLGVSAVMTGSVTRDGNRLRVTVALMQPSPERQLWTETYERTVGDVLGLSSEVAQMAVRSVRVMVTPAEEAQLAQTSTMKAEAEQEYLLGRFYWNKRTKADNEQAMQHFERAIAIDPNAALAYAGLADCYIVAWDEGYIPPEEAYREAKANAQRATALDDSIAEAHAALGAVYNFSVLWSQSDEEYRRALALNPGFARAHQWYSINLGALGRHAEAVAEARRAVELDPLSPLQNAFLGRQLYYAGEYAEAERQLNKTLRLAPTLTIAHNFLGRALFEEGRRTEAIRELENVERGLRRPVADLGYAYAASGDTAAAQQVLHALIELSKHEYVHPWEIGLVYVGLGDKNTAIQWILKEYDEREGVVQDLAIDPRLRQVSDDSRFQGILRKSGLAYSPGAAH